MSPQQLDTPVAFFVFNRPEVTRRVFAEIVRAKPRTLLIVADGARHDRDGEAKRTEEVRSIVQRIDWPCQVFRNYSEQNLGCKQRMYSGIEWVFSVVDRAIILEDDCLPSSAFFRFCAEMLNQYQGDARIFAVSGSSFSRNSDAEPRHYFSNYSIMWGWATWRDRWAKYQLEPADHVQIVSRMWIWHPLKLAYWLKIFSNLKSGRLSTWDYQWILTVWRNRGLVCRPTINLVENIGFGPDASHTTNSQTHLRGMHAYEIQDACSAATGAVTADYARDAVDESQWALINIRTVLLLYFPWIDSLRRRVRLLKQLPVQ
jgi:hypothetical protein